MSPCPCPGAALSQLSSLLDIAAASSLPSEYHAELKKLLAWRPESKQDYVKLGLSLTAAYSLYRVLKHTNPSQRTAQVRYEPAPPRGRTCRPALNYADHTDGYSVFTGLNSSLARDNAGSAEDQATALAAAGNRNRYGAQRGNFPPPYPNGWNFLCESKHLCIPKSGSSEDESAVESVRTFSMCGEELVAFRTEGGKVGPP